MNPTLKKIVPIIAGSVTTLIIVSLFWITIARAPAISDDEVPSNSFTSALILIDYLKADNLSDRNWTTTYTCENFAEDLIQRAKTKGYDCFTYHALYGEELDMFIAAVKSITVVRNRAEMIPTDDPVTKRLNRYQEFYHYDITPLSGVGHAVIKTSINGTELIIDPQTDIILRKGSRYNEMALITEEYFIVHYRGEIEEKLKP